LKEPALDVLFLAHRAPYPPDKGDRLRSYHVLRGLAGRATVDLVALADDEAAARAAREGLAPLCRELVVLPRRRLAALARVAGAVPGGSSLTQAWMADARALRAVRELGARHAYDVCWAFSSGTATWWRTARARRRVMDLCDLDALKWEALGASAGGLRAAVWRLEGRRLLRVERDLAAEADLVILSTARESGDLLARGGAPRRMEVLPHGTDWRAFGGLPPASVAPPVVGFLGQMDYAPNVRAALELAREVMPRVRRRVPDARLRVLGRSPAPALRRLAEADGSVEVTGAVGSVPAALGALAAFAAPLRTGRGLASKLLESLAAGRPLVLTPWAARSLLGEAGRDYLVADAPAAQAEALAGLLSDPARRDALGGAGRRLVREHYDWDALLARCVGLLEDVAGA
jgi:sugar transferase (PEP-CTERM/EpsH1 system associated)